jgi:hypothetical protein
MKAHCKNDFYQFEKNKYYIINNIYSVFDKDDFISIEDNEHLVFRFRLNKSMTYVDDFIGDNEYYFYDYFCFLNEERKKKLEKLSELEKS